MATRPIQSRAGGMGFRAGGGGGPVAAAHFGGAQFSRPDATVAPLGGGIQPSIRPQSGLKRAPTPLGQGAPPPNVGLTTEVTVDHRPVTQHGLTGMHTQPLGPQRRIADKSYYLTELRQKQTNIVNEIQKMRDEMQQIQSDNVLNSQYERRYETSIKEVHALEAQLADYNLALDKVRGNTNASEIQEMADRLKNKNQSERRQVDSVFLSAAQADKETRELEAKEQSIHDSAAKRLAALGEEVQQEYEELQEEHASLKAALEEKRNALASLDARIEQRNATLKSAEYKTHTKGLELTKRRKALEQEKKELEEEVTSTMSPQEMREKLLQRVKPQNQDIADTEKRIKQLEDETEKLQDDITRKENEIIEAKKHAAKAKKYEAVYDRDRKMQEFIDRFPETKQEQEESKKRLKAQVVALLNHISKGINLADNLPDAEKFNEMKDDLTFKEKTTENAKTTQARLEKDLEKRKDELEKINSLDKKINLEVRSLKDRINEMTNQMNNFKSVEQMQAEATEVKKNLLRDRQNSKKQREAIKQQIQLLSHQFEKKKTELSNNETMKKLDVLENRLRQYAQTVFTMEDFIQSRKRESDFEPIAREVSELTKSINALHVIAALSTGH